MEAPAAQEFEAALTLCQMSGGPIHFGQNGSGASIPVVNPNPIPNYRIDPRGLIWEPPVPIPSAPYHPANPAPARARNQTSQRRPVGWVRLRPADHGIGQAFATIMDSPPRARQNLNNTRPALEAQSIREPVVLAPARLLFHRPGFAHEECFLPEELAHHGPQQTNQTPYFPGSSLHGAWNMGHRPADMMSGQAVENWIPHQTNQNPRIFGAPSQARADTGSASSGSFERYHVHEQHHVEQNSYSSSQVKQGVVLNPFSDPAAQLHVYQSPNQEIPPVQPAPKVVAVRKRTPLPDRPLRCSKCAKGFTRMADLNKHLGLSEDCSRIWECHMCDKTFRGGRWLLRHHLRRAHGSQKCPYCPQVYLNPSGRDQHIRKRHSRCNVCGDFFSYAEDIVPHLLSAHGPTLAKARGASAKKSPVSPDESEDADDDEDEDDEEDDEEDEDED
ncbi:hypothetical protein ONS95_010577 [Cadophora gregata]|uniref:uncharacterized protein n=1 Tax=Cadophora gregata TaxID=51156 RepID=UPI0026DC72B5|nr:uncharacterized protein ONS95_010577 [Cadophora gregata]KAK0122336.1 hypothetical protein ONS95_010577 [Cadophora gregata]